MSDTSFPAQLAEMEAEQCGELTADRLAELRFLAESQFAIPVVPKHELALLLDAYEAQRRG